MAMTAAVKDELSRVECTKISERKAEVTALLRFSGGLHIVGGRVVIEAELDTGSVARRLRRDISEVYGYTSGVSVLAGGNIRSASTTAAYLAAADGSAVTMTHVVTAVEQEYRKLGRLVLEREFGRYHALLT